MNDIVPTTLKTENPPALLASVSELKTKMASTYKEQVYRKSLSDLAGLTFEPLAGLRVTFMPSMFPTATFEQPENSNVIYTIHYVEYLTGHKRLLMAVVELAEGYVPFNVDRTAFQDALKHSLEFHLNESGYTMAKDPPDGLRKVSQVHIGHERLQALFDPTAILKSHIAWQPTGVKSKITVDIEGDQLVSRSPANALKSLEYRLPGVQSCAGHLVSRGFIEQLIPYIDQDLVVFFKESLHHADRSEVAKVIALDHGVDLPGSEYYPGNFMAVTRAYRIRVLPAESQYQTIARGNFKLGSETLSHHIDVTLIDAPDEGKIEVLDPENWAFVFDVASGYFTQFTDDNKITPYGDSMPLRRLSELGRALKNNPDLVQYYVEPDPTVVPEPIIEPEVVAAPIEPEKRILPWTIFDRIAMAWKAFNTPDPLKED